MKPTGVCLCEYYSTLDGIVQIGGVGGEERERVVEEEEE